MPLWVINFDLITSQGVVKNAAIPPAVDPFIMESMIDKFYLFLNALFFIFSYIGNYIQLNGISLIKMGKYPA